jgi:NADH dehydrogenase
VGAGPTGVELAGALSEIARDTLRHDFRSIRPEESRILLLDGFSRVLPSFPEDLSAAAERSLIRLCVRPLNSVKVTGIDGEGVTIQTPTGAQRIAARTVLWAAGVMASEFGKVLAQAAGAALNRHGQVQVNPDLTIPGHPEIFVIGDLAYIEQDGKPLPGVAPVAMQEGRCAAETIMERLRGRTPQPFRYFNKGNLAVIGRAAAVADFGFIRLHGLLAWLLWLFVHLMYIVQFSSRLIVFIRWGFLYLTFDRGARLITGDATKARP